MFDEIGEKQIVLFGAGQNAQVFLDKMEEAGVPPCYFVDNNVAMHAGKKYEVRQPNVLLQEDKDNLRIIITVKSLFVYEKIEEQLINMGLGDCIIKQEIETLFRTATEKEFRLHSYLRRKNNTNDVCVIGNYINENIGGQLTVLATYKTIEALGYGVKILKFSNHFTRSVKRKMIWEYLCNFSNATEKDLPAVNACFNAFVTTPDWTFYKTWNKGWDVYMQPWTSEEKTRIAFAASFGKGAGSEYVPQDYSELKRRLTRFHALGVREPQSVEFCKSIGIDNAMCMHDAVFALDKRDYIALSELDRIDRPPLQTLVGGPYLISYLRNYSEEKLQQIADIAAQLHLQPLLLIGSEKEKQRLAPLQLHEKRITYVTDITLCEWLWFINNSHYVVTDSFHATCFSLILNKPYILFTRDEAGLYTKLAALSDNIGMQGRLVNVDICPNALSDLLQKPINWDIVNTRLATWKAEAVSFINNALDNNQSKRGSICKKNW
ncbi:MAG: polysaccharide pyruvyl transferase family protein [Defluviitaleaceae bacterium]|nr:polysaccharide pyruvyl transferase family protein [Defluviitaleaceae bacterium]MCL2274437.1 polysaccharide pyruvyl transferase family protein [Defluviitaleaceae bacterium]